jgi:hypothetical protein
LDRFHHLELLAKRRSQQVGEQIANPTSTHEYSPTSPRKNLLRFVPFSRMISARWISAGSLISSAPPSPQVMFFV